MRMNQVVASIVTLALSASIAFAGGGTAFTYQGRLLDAGKPANGLFDLEFELWDAAKGGNPVGVPQVLNNTPVTDGLFTVQLDFGAGAFDNTGRWLAISVDGVPLMPRQPITRAPYSIQTRGIFVDQDQNVGIGTSAPPTRLAVKAVADGSNVISWLNSTGNIAGTLSSASGSPSGAGALLLNDGNGITTVLISGHTENSFINTGGNLGIGTSAPPTRLAVKAVADGSNVISWLNSTGNIAGTLSSASGSPSGAGALLLNDGNGITTVLISGHTENSFINTGGNLGIGTGAPGFRLEVNGDAGKPGGGSWSNSSDRRLKKNVEDLDGALDQLLRLRGVTFEYKDPATINELPGERIGMIAQEVEEVLPDWVNINSRGHKTVTFRGFEALTVEALRDLRTEKDRELANHHERLGAVERENEELRERNADLESRLSQLEALVTQLAAQQAVEQ